MKKLVVKKPKSDPNKHYVNNKQLYKDLVEWNKKCNETDGPDPRIPDSIAGPLFKICENLSRKANFIGYTFREDMVGDGIENCLKGIKGFNCDKYDNPHAFFTMVAFNAFVRRIKTEAKQTYIKHKNFENTLMNLDDYQELKANDFHDDIIRNYEDKLTKDKEKANMKKIKINEEINDE